MPKFASVLMCRPTHFDVAYVINPWMKKEKVVDRNKAQFQWNSLKQAIEQFLGKTVQTVAPQKDLPDMVFATDQGIVLNGIFVKSNFYYQQRRRETKIYAQWFAAQGYQIKTFPKGCFLEGGDVLPWREGLLVGYGFRTQKQSLKLISQETGKRIVPLKLVSPWYYHLDTALLVLDEDTILWNPTAFSPASRQRLRSLGVDLIPVHEQDARKFVLNSLVSEKRIIVGKGINGTLDILKKRGWEVLSVDVSEFLKSGGGIHCLVCQL